VSTSIIIIVASSTVTNGILFVYIMFDVEILTNKLFFLLHGGPHKIDRRSCSFLAVHVCAPAHLPIGVLLVCPAKQDGPRRENLTFSGLEDMSPRGGGTTDRGRLASTQKTAVFLSR